MKACVWRGIPAPYFFYAALVNIAAGCYYVTNYGCISWTGGYYNNN